MVDSNTSPRRTRNAIRQTGKTAVPVRGSRRKADSATTITAAERLSMIETAAYYRAERRGFRSGHEADDWLSAEAEVDAMIAAARGPAAGVGVKRSGASKNRAN